MVELRHESGSRAVVNPDGAFVESLIATDGTALLFSRRDMPNGKNRGGIPVCAPIFGPGETVGLWQHGFARNLRWNVIDQQQSMVKLSLDNPRSQLDTIPPLYTGCSMELTVVMLENGIRETLTIYNKDVEACIVNPAFHPYFPISDHELATDAVVQINGRQHSFDQEELGATQKLDSVDGTAQLKTAQGIWTVIGQGLSFFCVWSESPQDFICVEPTQSGDLADYNPSELQPNNSLTVGMTITYSPLQ